MSIKLIGVLTVLMLVNHVVGTSYGAFKDGFDRRKFAYGTWKFLTVLGGYAAIAFAAYYANDYIKGIEYISGILLEPIARYFVNVIDKLKELVNENVGAAVMEKSFREKASSEAAEYFTLHSIPANSVK